MERSGTTTLDWRLIVAAQSEIEDCAREREFGVTDALPAARCCADP
jgi:hypothetical protein